MYLNRITLIGFIGSDAERKVANATSIAIFSLATKTSWKNDAGSWESRTYWHRCVAFGKLADFAATLSKGAHVAIEGELPSHEYQRGLAVGTQKTTLTQASNEFIAHFHSERNHQGKGNLLLFRSPATTMTGRSSSNRLKRTCERLGLFASSPKRYLRGLIEFYF